MRKLFIALLVLCSLHSFAQTTTAADRVVARQSLYLRDWWVDSVGRDTAFAGKVRVIPTADAVYRMVAGRITSVQVSDGDKGDITVSGSGATWTIDKPTLSTLTYGATTTWDYATQGAEVTLTLAGNTTLNITNLPAGKVVYLTCEVHQDLTGGRGITLPASTKVIGGGAGAITLTTTGGATDLITFRWNGTTLFANLGTNYN